MLAFVVGVRQGTAEVLDQVLLFLLAVGAVQVTGLLEVLLTLDLRLLGTAGQGQLAVAGCLRFFARQQPAGLVIHPGAGMTAVHHPILIAVVDRDFRRIDRQLQRVRPQAIHLRIGIGEDPALQQPILGRLDTRHQVGRGHGDLLGFLEDIRRVAIQHHLPDLALRHARPDLGGIQRIEVELAQVRWRQDLDIQIPLRKLALVDMRHQIVGHMAVILALHFDDRFWIQVSNPLQALPMELDVMHVALGIDQLVGMHTIAIHLPVTGRRTGVRVQLGQSTSGLRDMGEEVETPRVVIEVGPRIGLEGMHHVRELDGIANEEGREVVAHQVPVAFAGIELGGEATRIAQGFRRVVTVHHRGETHEYRGGAAGGKDLGLAQVAQVIGDGKGAMGAGAPRMHDALRNALTVEALEFLDQLYVLQQHRPGGAGGLRVLVIANRGTVVTGQGRGLDGQG